MYTYTYPHHEVSQMFFVVNHPPTFDRGKLRVIKHSCFLLAFFLLQLF